MKLKKTKDKLKISKDLNSIYAISTHSTQFPTFSFKYMTSNSSYNIDFFTADKLRMKSEALSSLHRRFEEISKQSWVELAGKAKDAGGYETIPFSSVHLSPSNKYLSADENIIVFRVKSTKNMGEMRILGFKEKHEPVYHILGYDFQFNAYNHGK